MTMIEAINDAMHVALEQDPQVVVFGQDVGFFGGVFRATEGLQRKHGIERVFDTPIAEGGIVAIAVGMGAYRSEEHTSELQSLLRISYAVFCLQKKRTTH